MSSKSSPGGFSGSMSRFYDPDFTAQISTKMQVPDKISLRSDDDQRAIADPSPSDQKDFMHVPERILVAGGGDHIAAREPPPELQFESAVSAEPQRSALTTPPRVINLNEYSYPGIDVNLNKNNRNSLQNVGNGILELNDSAINVYRNPEEEILILRKRVELLSHRVASMEQENQIRQQREILLYSVGVVYFLLKGLIWLNRHI